MSTPLKTFTGFKGTAAMVQIGKVQFAILAKNPRELEILWNGILQEAGPFDSAMCKKAILIEASLLPDAKPAPGYQDNLDRLNASLEAESGSASKPTIEV